MSTRWARKMITSKRIFILVEGDFFVEKKKMKANNSMIQMI